MINTSNLSYISSKEDKQLKSLSQEDLLRIMTNPKVKKLIDDYRSGDVEAKSKLPAVLFNGKFSEEKYQNYIAACKEKGIMLLQGNGVLGVRKGAGVNEVQNSDSTSNVQGGGSEYTVKVNGKNYAVKLDGDKATVNGKSYDIDVKEGIEASSSSSSSS